MSSGKDGTCKQNMQGCLLAGMRTKSSGGIARAAQCTAVAVATATMRLELIETCEAGAGRAWKAGTSADCSVAAHRRERSWHIPGDES